MLQTCRSVLVTRHVICSVVQVSEEVSGAEQREEG